MTTTYEMVPTKQAWTRADEGIIAGVCKGLAEKFELDPWLVRIGWLVAILAFGTGIVAYFILAFALPRASEVQQPAQKRLLGVCLKLSKQTGIDVGLIRALTLFSAIASAGLTLFAYLCLYLLWQNSEQNEVI